MSMKLEVAADYGNEIGENPLWHPLDNQLYWCSHNGSSSGELFRYDPSEDKHEKVYETNYIGGFTIQTDGSLLLFKNNKQVTVCRKGEEEILLEGLEEEDEDVLFNDVIADPEGRVFCGVRYEDDRLGALYRLDRDRTLTKVVEGIEASNGLGFSRLKNVALIAA